MDQEREDYSDPVSLPHWSSDDRALVLLALLLVELIGGPLALFYLLTLASAAC